MNPLRPPGNPSSPSYVSFSEHLEPLSFWQQTSLKVTSFFTSIKESLPFMRPSHAAVDQVLSAIPLPSALSSSQAPSSSAPSLPINSSAATAGPVPAVDEEEDDDDRAPSSPTPGTVAAASPAAPTNEALIAGVLMKFTVTIDEEPISVTPEMLKHLLPIFNQLAAKETSLTTGFACNINLKDLKDIRFYQNGVEAFKKTSQTLLSDSSLLQHLQEFDILIKNKKHVENALKQGDLNPIIPETSPTITPNYIEDVPGNGDCLLYAALKHIKNNRHLSEADARADVTHLRQQIAARAVREDLTAEETLAIITDIEEARATAQRLKVTNAAPFEHLFTPEMNGIFSHTTFEWTGAIGQAYKNYLLDDSKAFLGQFAINFLNEQHPADPFYIVVPGLNGTFIPRDARGNVAVDIGQRKVLLLEGNHYKYVDATNPAFQAAFKPTPSS